MPSPTVNFIKAPNVSSEQRLQNARRREAMDLQQQMEVVRHQNIGVERERIALTHRPKRLDEGLIVALAEKNFCPPLPRAIA